MAAATSILPPTKKGPGVASRASATITSVVSSRPATEVVLDMTGAAYFARKVDVLVPETGWS